MPTDDTATDQIRPILGALCSDLTDVQMQQLGIVWHRMNATYTPHPDDDQGYVEDPDMTAARTAGLVSAAEFLLGRLTLAAVEERLDAAAEVFNEVDAAQIAVDGPGVDPDLDRRLDAARRDLTSASVARFAVAGARDVRHIKRWYEAT